MSTWRMWAGEQDGEFCNFGHRRYAQAYGHAEPVEVILTEDPDGPYWGWLDTRPEREDPCMIYRREAMFRICFPYGVEAEEAAGRGRVVRLAVRAA